MELSTDPNIRLEVKSTKEFKQNKKEENISQGKQEEDIL